MIRALVLVLAWTALAAAETRRVAVIVGNNAGGEGQPALRYAEVDAGKVSRVLVELGGVAPGDLFLLQGKDLAALDGTLHAAKTKITAYKQRLDRVVVIFYYSGHSDGMALELGRDRFTFAALRRWLEDTGADVRLGLVDSCKSGALLATKGGTPGPAFQIRLTDDLSSTGEALLTSSAADENALESREIGGSFFTHHLVSGLRGAADASGDARVTLGEAYRYAYEHTIATSGATIAGPQHPAYDYRLSGQGELILTELARPSAALVVPDGFERVLVTDRARDQVIAELGRGAPARIAVVPGRYAVRAWRGADVVEGTVTIAAAQIRAVRWDELRAIAPSASRSKGGIDLGIDGEVRPTAALPVAIAVAAGGSAAIASQLDALAGIRAGVRSRSATGFSLAVDATTRSEATLRETSMLVYGGYRVGVERGRLRAWAGLELGAGMIRQHVDATSSSAALALSPLAGASIAIARTAALALELQVPATLLQRDDATTVVALPAAWLGVIIAP